MSFKAKLKGKEGEDIACKFLKKRGYKILTRNFRTKMGEIDIIAEKKGTVVFFEVKTRKSRRYGLPKEYVSELKKKRILSAALFYLTKKKLWNRPIRFDVIGLILDREVIEVEHERDVIHLSDAMDSSNSYWQPW